ncbi:MAG: amidohydrolase family protein [Candidatus Woesearchaeota archaeon]
MKLLKNCKYIYDGKEVLENKDIIIKNNSILKVRNSNNSKNKKKDKEYEKVIDCSNHAIFPSLFNAHTHSPMIFLRSYKDNLGFHNWLDEMFKVEENINKKLIYESTILGIYEMIKTGTSGFLDMYYNPKQIKKACDEIGIYGVISTKKELTKSKHVMPARFLHAIYTESVESLKKQAKIAKDKNQILNIHISETRKELNDCYEENGMYPVEYLNKLGILSEKTVGAHLSWVTKREIKILKENKVHAVTCPTSNLKLATGGTLQYREFKDEGVPLSLGTDSVASNNTLNMLSEAKVFSIIQKNNYWDSKIASSYESLNLALSGWDIAKNYGIKAGKIKKDYLANLFGINLNKVEMIPTYKENLVSNLIYTTPSIDFHYINGKEVYNSKKQNKIEKRIIKSKKIIDHFVKNNMLN